MGRELQSNTDAIRTASVQAATSVGAEVTLAVATDPTLARIRRLGTQAGLASLNEDEAYRFLFLMRQTWINLQNFYLQNESGLFEPRLWAGYHRTICGIWSSPGAKEGWIAQGHRAVLDPGFVQLVENCGGN